MYVIYIYQYSDTSFDQYTIDNVGNRCLRE